MLESLMVDPELKPLVGKGEWTGTDRSRAFCLPDEDIVGDKLVKGLESQGIVGLEEDSIEEFVDPLPERNGVVR